MQCKFHQLYFFTLLVIDNFNIILPSLASLPNTLFTNGYVTDILNEFPAPNIQYQAFCNSYISMT
jgi:hypothetical protein